MRESEELREPLLFLGQEIGTSHCMKVPDLIVNRFKIEYHKMVDELMVSHPELYVAISEPLEQNPLRWVSSGNNVCSIQELNSYGAAKAPSDNLILRSHLVAIGSNLWINMRTDWAFRGVHHRKACTHPSCR